MKRRISIMLVLAMLITNLLSVVSFADFSDVAQDNQYRDSIITLTKLGIINGYDDGTFKPEGQITRAEFTKMLVTALGKGDAMTEPTEFSDVSEHWARYNIKTAYDLGIINGFEDGTFKPDDQVTYEQALKMIVCTLGYVDFAEAMGGYPTGYTSQAEEMGITKGVTGQKYNEPALRQVISQVVYNSLEIEKREKNMKGIWELSGKTILENDLGIHMINGILTGVEDLTTDDCTQQLLNYQMCVKANGVEHVIDTRNYKEMTIAGLQNYVGNEVTVYYREERSRADKYLVVFDTETVKNEITTISYDTITDFDGSTLRYYPEGSIRKKSISINVSELTVIYNGQTLDDTSDYTLVSKGPDIEEQTVTGKVDVLTEILDPSSDFFIYGDVVLTDSGSDGRYDMVTVNDYRWMIAHKAVSNTDYKVQNTLVTSDILVLDVDDPALKIYIEKNGKAISPIQIAKNDVVTYTKSFDGTIIKAYVSKKSVEGLVESISEDKITIDGKEYNLDPNCERFITEKAKKTLTIGNDVKMYLDKLGTAIYGEISEAAAAPYAYIISQVYEVSDDTFYITAYIPSISTSTAKKYKVAEKVQINGIICDSYTEVQDVLDDTVPYNNPDSGATNATYSQVARIKVSSDEITEIVTLDPTATGANADPSTIVKSEALNNYTYSSGSFKINGATKFSINSSTVIIDVPSDRSQKDNYAKRSSGYFSNGSTYSNIEAYDINDNKYAGLLIRYTTGDNSNYNSLNRKNVDSSHRVVGSTLTTGYDSESGTTVTQVPVYSSSTTLKSWNVLPAANSEFRALEVGDVIQFDYDNANMAQNLEYVIKYSDIKSVLSGTTYDWTGEQTQTPENRWQKYVFDFKYPNKGASATEKYFEPYQSPSLGEIAHSRATMFNVVRVIEEEGKLHVTREGFEEDGTMSDDVLYDDVDVTSSTKILKAVKDQNGDLTEFTAYEADGTTPLSIESFQDVQIDGTNCSKIMVSTNKGEVKLIVIYE